MRRPTDSWLALVLYIPVFFVVTLAVGLVLTGDAVGDGVKIAGLATVIWVSMASVTVWRSQGPH